jgi:hypothetical protein
MVEAGAGVVFPCEVVGVIATREAFEQATRALLAAGFSRSDLSVLASHESIDVAGRPATRWQDALFALLGDIRYETALVASGAVFLAGGPLAATVAAIIGTAVGGIAVRDVLQEVTARPHTEHFARSLEAGSLILWVAVADADALSRATAILQQHGATNVHAAHRTSAAAVAP